jgi:Protein of unknown function (DUF968).
MNLLNTHGIRKEPRFNSKEYLGWIAKHNCVICGSHESQVHHVIYKSAGNSGSDIFTIPLCAKDHAEYHKLGREGFENKHMMDMETVVASFLERFCLERGVNLQQAVTIFIESLITELA